MKKANSKEMTRLAEEAMDIMRKLEDVKVLYGRLDEITMALKGQDLSRFGLAVIDNFAEKNVVFRPSGVRRFELKRIA